MTCAGAKGMRAKVNPGDSVPPPPGNLHEYQNKGVAGGAVWMKMKRRELENVGLRSQNRECGARIKNREDIASFAVEAQFVGSCRIREGGEINRIMRRRELR